jgi:hypothetical protein
MKKATIVLGIVFVAILLAAGIICAAEEKPLDNAQVISMTKADLGDSVIIAKIKASKEVKFDLETDDLVKLKGAGVSKAVITAMLDRSSAKSSSSSSAGPKVLLSSKSGDIELKAMYGTLKQYVAPFVGLRRFVEFSPKAATTRIKDRQPAILVASDKDPGRTCAYVKIYHDKDNRWIDLEAPGGWGGSISNRPYGECLLKYSVAEEKSGAWSFKPDNTLEPDDYGLYCFSGQAEGGSFVIYEFGIDK